MLLRIVLGITVALTAFVLVAEGAQARRACKATAAGEDYRYRIVDGRKCWYDADDVLSKSDLYWRAPKVKPLPAPRIIAPATVAVQEAPVFPPPIEDIEAYIIASHFAVMLQPRIDEATVEAAQVELPPPAEFDPVFVERWAPAVMPAHYNYSEVRNIPLAPFRQSDAGVVVLTASMFWPIIGLGALLLYKDRQWRLDQPIPSYLKPIQLRMEPVTWTS